MDGTSLALVMLGAMVCVIIYHIIRLILVEGASKFHMDFYCLDCNTWVTRTFPSGTTIFCDGKGYDTELYYTTSSETLARDITCPICEGGNMITERG